MNGDHLIVLPERPRGGASNGDRVVRYAHGVVEKSLMGMCLITSVSYASNEPLVNDGRSIALPDRSRGGVSGGGHVVHYAHVVVEKTDGIEMCLMNTIHFHALIMNHW
jgi:hypothetical protein